MNPGIQRVTNLSGPRISRSKLGLPRPRVTSVGPEDPVFNIVEAVDPASDIIAVDFPEAAKFDGRLGEGSWAKARKVAASIGSNIQKNTV